MSDELKWPEPDSYAVMAFGTHQKLVVRADVAEEWASKYREQGFINVSVVPLFTYAQTCELVASLRSELEAARGKVEALTDGLICKEAALIEWFDKTDWLGKCIKPHELGKHRADVMRERVEALSREKVSTAAFDQIFALNESNAKRVIELEDQLEALSKQEPFAWLVCSINSDGSPSLEHAAQWPEAAHEHINDAITEHEIEGAADWVVRPVYLKTVPQLPTPNPQSPTTQPSE